MADEVDLETNLTSEQTEKLLQFQDITGIEDIERCRVILGSHRWEIEPAVQAQFSDDHPVRRRESPPPVTVREPVVDAHPIDQQLIIRPQWPQGFRGWGAFIFYFPFKFIYFTLLDIFRFAYRLVFPRFRSGPPVPAIVEIENFIQEFENSYGNIHPRFLRGSYNEAISKAKNELKFLLIYLHSNDHQHTVQFCRSTLSNPQIVEFVDSHALFWACNVNTHEGYRVSQTMREETYPFLALIVLRDNRMTVVARIVGMIERDEFMARLQVVIENNEASLIAARSDREERSFTRSLREEQDAALEESLRKDQEKERIKKEVKALLLKEEEEKTMRINEIQERKEILRNNLAEEPDSNDPCSIKILLKLPSGVRLERRFLTHMSMKELYNFVFVHEAAPDDFQIFSTYPRRAIPCQPTAEQPEPLSFEAFGLGHSEMLFVQDNDA